MHALATSPHYEQVLHQVALLTAEEQLRLLGEISAALRKRIPATIEAALPQTDIIRTVKGKYSFVPTSSELFARSKLQEIATVLTSRSPMLQPWTMA